MVGVPGRSKACVTCRKRRKGCGQERPACSQCQRAGIECGGYDQPRVFVVSTPTTRRAGYRSAPQAFAGSSWQRGFSPESLSNPSNEVAGNIVANSALLGRPELERRWIDLFWEAYFPAGKPIPALVSRNYTCSWTNTAQKLYEGDHSLRYALWANALLMEGRRQGAGWILREGSKMYGRALAGLRRSLEAPHTAKRDAVIATVKLVSLFEAYSRQGGGDESESEGDDHHNHQPRALPPLPSQNWQRHCAGELALFVARTPEAHVEGNSHQVFADERVEMALSGILRRRRLPFSAPEWKSIPWKETPKDLKDILVDVLVDVPGLVEDFDVFRACIDPAEREDLRLALIDRCWALDEQLRAWFGLILKIITPKDPPPEFVVDLVVRVAQIHGMMAFWTISLVMFTILHIASGPEAHLLPARTDPIFFANKLANTALPILMDPQAGLFGHQSAVLPLEILYRFVTDFDRARSQRSEELFGVMGELKHRLEESGWHVAADTGIRTEIGV
ncbi:Sterigmatocystin biosynthesis regulatory protein [Cladorrhinum samala]|uniref:Sterigmatocystin biosynthesis regulatory protein n=1 Tax=Cladorrhinum samala TaxID=585594 RepID=A0AAV9HT28_9PEZI|nr:Sterigmatocystin biosynthesis regulatory protein [Cladorrhinum samala]